ncbi:MAG: hypothetical protein NT005_13030 [Spirochaetes bacterium]|nr:hypothetical protein [Spirochaetota bacterium]
MKSTEHPPAAPHRRRAATAVLFVLLALILLPGTVAAQSAVDPPRALPRGFRGLTLGMELEQVKQALAADPLYRYRGDPDVSFLPQTRQFLIECAGSSWIRRAYFQFADSGLFIMILVLDAQRLDHYSLFTALSSKYGGPSTLSPQESVWLSNQVRFSLERPLTVKYIDAEVFSRIVQKGAAAEDLDRVSRESFLEQF